MKLLDEATELEVLLGVPTKIRDGKHYKFEYDAPYEAFNDYLRELYSDEKFVNLVYKNNPLLELAKKDK